MPYVRTEDSLLLVPKVFGVSDRHDYLSAALDPAATKDRIDDLYTVLELSCQLAATPDLQTLLGNIVTASLRVLNCEKATVFLYDPQTQELYSRVATDAVEIRFPANRGLAGEVFRTGAVINVPDAYADARFNPDVDRRTGYRTRSILSCPLVGWDKTTVGVLQVLNKRDGSFGAWDEELARTFTSQAGVAVQRQLLLAEYGKKQRFERELDLARQIQQGLLPRRSPRLTGFDIAGWNKPADETGGDFFDYKELPSGNLAVSIADVSGHGVAPALVMAECRALLRASLSQSDDLGKLIEHVNRLLCEDVPDDYFVTVFCSVLEPNGNRLRYLSAGHGPVLHLQAANGMVDELATHGCPLGFSPDLDYDPPSELTMATGDLVVLMTDGFFEWRNTTNEQFGVPRIASCLQRNRELPSAEIIQCIYRDVLAFGTGVAQRDDLTAVVIKKTP